MHLTKNNFLFWLKLSLGSGLLYLLFYQIDLDNFIEILTHVKLEYVLLSVFVSSISLYVKGYKWQLLLKLQGAEISVSRAVNLTFISIFFNNFFLGTLGGDGFRALKTINNTDKKAGAVSAIIMDRISGVAALLSVVIVSAGASLIWDTEISKVPMMKQIFMLSLFSLIIFVIVLIGLLKFNNKITLQNDYKIMVFLMDILSTLGRHRLTDRIVIISLFLSVFYHLIAVLAMYMFVLALGISISGVDMLVIVPIVAFLLMIPISINGIGIQEGAFFYFFILIGVTSEQALVLSILPRIGVIVLSCVGGMLFLVERKSTKSKS